MTTAEIERRLLCALAEPAEGAEGRKRAFLDVLRVLGREGVKYALAGDLGLWLRAMRPGSMRLELAVGSLAGVPWGMLEAEGFAVGRTSRGVQEFIADLMRPHGRSSSASHRAASDR